MAPAVVGTYPTTSRLVEVQLDGAQVAAEIMEPIGAAGLLPGVVFLHGAGTGHHTAFTEQARALASAGIVALVPDKRLDTYTTNERDYVAMARDYHASVEAVRALPGVDPDRVGIYGESEGAWIAPVLAAEDPAIDFMALISAPVVAPRVQAAFATDSYLRNVGVPPGLMRAIPRATGVHVPGGGFDYVDFDATPYMTRVTQPVFMAYGTDDASMPIVQGPLQVMDQVAGGSDSVLLRYYAGANHGIRYGSSTGPLVEEFLEGLARWMLDPVGTTQLGPQIAGDTPVQRYVADVVPTPRWFADGQMLVWTTLGAVLVLALGPILWGAARLVARIRGRAAHTLPPPLARRSGTFAAVTLGTVVVLLGYVYQIAQLALNYRQNDLFVWGGWVALQALGVAAAALGVVSVGAAVRTLRTGGVRAFGVVGGLGWLCVHLGSAALLLVAAYWGVYSPLW
ncbi:dipeptidylaminopeptidase/acylaminoacyl-peptidase [Beutenbergia cavernae DSM 12333]|uniref:Dipeptidylaminopeptidase/acylaminoacyl-peptidase n=1 Tax=Beutenbergia cavernae (strain ATCC BAA-8 / DSM 12333 / CCUG 43141 / JCM 11478 / NBRC 16432 / NCIMB 13614 / HKI 0122) TaxID=471853 RepID=C5C496_BEUC1|nr:dipeptidylaminopeptidase/acylaminoacyl-peptidase [Beutenbergia cavernae DSM 12333]